MPIKTPNRLWILMYRSNGRIEWVPSMDHFCAWNTKKAAEWKRKSLPDPSFYRVFKYERGA